MLHLGDIVGVNRSRSRFSAATRALRHFANGPESSIIDVLGAPTIMSPIDRNSPRPTEIKLHQKSRELEIAFDNGNVYRLPSEYLRVYSPSAEVRGHGPGQEVLQTGKKNVEINNIEAVGSYAIALTFSDGHDSGIYSWDYLHELGLHQDELWQRYLDRLAAAGASRESVASPYEVRPKSK